MERYDNVIPRPLQLNHLKPRRRRRPRPPAAIAELLHARSAHLYDAAVARGLVALPGEDDAADDPGVTEGVAGGVAPGDADEGDELGDSAGAEAEGKGEEDGGEVDRDDAGDMRTEAQRRFDAVAEAREKERLQKVAGVSYKEQVDKFNKSLAEQPEHFDLFKVSHTK